MHSTIAATELSIQFNRVWEFVRMGGQGGVEFGLGERYFQLDHLEQVFWRAR
jgi:hypothetical protein